MKARIALILVLWPLLLSAQTSSPERPVKVGVILPLSGDSASIGVSIKNGMMLAYEKLSSANRNKLKLIFEDDQLTPAKTVSAFHKLTQLDDIDVLVTGYSGPSKAVSGLSEQKKIPQIAIASDPEIVRGKRYPVNFWVTPEAEAGEAVTEAIRRQYKRIVRVTSIQQGFLAIKEAFDRSNEGRIEVILDEEFSPDVKDFRSFINKTRQQPDIDAVLVLLMVNGQTGLFAKQARELGLNLPLFNVEGFEDVNEQQLSGGSLEGQWYITNDDPSDEFSKEYLEHFPSASIFAAGNGYDTVSLLVAAAAKNPSREGINDFLHTLKDFKGVLGKYSSTPDNRFTLPAKVKVVRGERG